MFNKLTEQEAKSNILDMVSEYCRKYHGGGDLYQEGDRIQYAGHIFGSEEITALVECALSYWLAGGKHTEAFEASFAKFLNVKYVSLVNSGSSANLIAFMALTSPLLKDRAINRGDEVITVAAGFPTTIAPIIQYGAVPVFVDITIPQYNIDVAQLEEALSKKTKAVILAHTLGNPFDLKVVIEFCKQHNLWLIEDNCDALGSKYAIDGKERYTGTFGDIGTSSFYPPHHITMGEGGAVYTDNTQLHKIIRSMRDWGRDCICPPGQDNFCNHRFDGQFGSLPAGYDHKYVYSHFGYNLKATDMQASVGCEQLKRLPEFIARRIENYGKLRTLLGDLTNYLVLPEACPSSQPSWFGFLLTCKEEMNRNKIVQYMEEKGVQTRMLFAGNILRHPCFSSINENSGCYRVIGNMENTDRVLLKTFWIGVYPGLTDQKIEYMSRIIHEACSLK